MKFLIICAVIMVGALANEWDRSELECIKELGIKTSDWEGASDPKEKPELYSKLTECIWKNLNLIDDEGTIDWDAVKAMVVKTMPDGDSENESSSKSSEEELDLEWVTNCDIKENDKVQKMVKVQSCLFAHIKKVKK